MKHHPIIRPATGDDRKDILDLVAGIFHRRDGSWYADRSWHRLSSRNFHPQSYIVATIDDRIVGVSAFIPLTLRMTSVKLPWIGVAAVCTDPDYRGLGIMGSILRAGIEHVDDEGFPISILWGDRLRYGRYGWEQAGSHINLDISRRQFPDPGWSSTDRDPRQSVRLSKLTAAGQHTPHLHGVAKRLTRIQQRYGGYPFRSNRHQAGLISRYGSDTYVADVKGEEAYVVIRPSKSTSQVVDYAGAPRVLFRLIGHVLATVSEKARLTVPTEPNAYESMLLRHADRLHVAPTGMVRIHCLRRLLAFYEPWWATKRRNGAGKVTLNMKDETTGGGQTVTVAWDPERVTVQRTECKPDDNVPAVTIGRRAMTHLLFGPVAPRIAVVDREIATVEGADLYRVIPALEALFPLPLYVPVIERV